MTDFDIPDTGYFEYGTLVAVRYLKTRLPANVVVASNVPNPRPERLVVVQGATTGGTMSLALGRRRVIISCYDTTEARSCRMAEMVRGYLIDGMRSRGTGYREARILGEPAYYPDPSDPTSPRAQLTVDLLVRSRFSAWDGS